MRDHTRRAALAATLAIASVGLPVRAGAADPAVARIDGLDQALIQTMKDGPALGARGRFHKLEPVVESAFDLPLMARFAVGSAWQSLSDADRQALIRGFGRLTAASYAHNFDRFGGERFTIDPDVQTRGPDKIVQSKLIAAGRAPVNLMYRMRQSGGGWKIVDVYYDGVSQLTTRRADFAQPLAKGGAKGLEAHLEATTAALTR